VLGVGLDYLSFDGRTLAPTHELDSPMTCRKVATLPHSQRHIVLAVDRDLGYARLHCLASALEEIVPDVLGLKWMAASRDFYTIDKQWKDLGAPPVCLRAHATNHPQETPALLLAADYWLARPTVVEEYRIAGPLPEREVAMRRILRNYKHADHMATMATLLGLREGADPPLDIRREDTTRHRLFPSLPAAAPPGLAASTVLSVISALGSRVELLPPQLVVSDALAR
jgi:hypothetical protein